MIGNLGTLAAIVGAFVVSLIVAPLPNGDRITLPPPRYTVEGSPTERILPPLAPTSPLDASNPPTPTTVPLPPIGACSAWAGYALGFGWPAVEAPQLARIMFLESTCNPAAVGDGGDSRGLLQIHCPTWVEPSQNWPTGWAAANGYPITCDDLHDPATNLAIGFLIWAGVEGSGGGWWNWTTYTP